MNTYFLSEDVLRAYAKDLERRLRENGGFPDIWLPVDRTTWSDHWYEMATDPGKSTLVLEDEEGIRGFISYEVEAGEDLRVDEVAVDRACSGRGIGGHLVRWAENVARANRCRRIMLWSAEERKNWYANHGYSELGRVVALGPDGAFTLMGKPVLYSLEDPAFPPRIR